MSFVIFRDQKAFMGYFGQKAGPETAALYKTLVDEEGAELNEAWDKHQAAPSAETVTEIADACIDLIYVLTGLMHGLGLDPQPLWNEVHRSNIDKIKHLCTRCNGSGTVEGEAGLLDTCPDCSGQGYIYEVRKRREDGKVLKPDGWQPPALLPLVRGMLAEQEGGAL